MPIFRYHPDIIERFPQLRAGIIIGAGLTNPLSAAPLKDTYMSEQSATLLRIADTPLSDIVSLAAWRKTFRSFGVNPTKYRSAPEALLRRLTKKGDIPSINTLVDISNLVSIRFALPVAAFDRRDVRGPVTVKFAEGAEHFTPLGRDLVDHPKPGEVIFADDRDMVVARRWCWRQSTESAANVDTKEVIATIEAQHERGMDDVQAALSDLMELLKVYAGGTYISGLLGPENLEI